MLEQAASRFAAGRQTFRPALDPALLRQLAAALLVAALVETTLLRLVTRVGVHLPRDEAVRGFFQVASLLGSLAFNFASVLSIGLAVLLLGLIVLRLEGTIARLGMGALSAAMLGGLGLSLAMDRATADALFGLAVTLLVGLLGLALVQQNEVSGRGRLALGLIVAAYLCYQYYALGYLINQRLLDNTSGLPLSIAALRLGEGLVVAAGLAVFWAWGIERWRRAGFVGVAAVAAVLVAITLSSLSPVSTTSILALWTTGLSLFLPLPVYLLALGLYLVTLLACWRSGDAFWTASGLLLLLLAGYMPEATYHHLLLLLGVACLSGTLRWAAHSFAEADPGVPA